MIDIDELFLRFDESGRQLVKDAYSIVAETLKDARRENGDPFLNHPEGVARIVYEEIGLPAECVAAVFLHEAVRFNPTLNVSSGGRFGHDILKMVDGLNKISTINPKDTRLEADNYKKLICSYSTDPRVVIIKIADRLEVMRSLDIFPKASMERKNLETLMLYIPLAHQLGLYNIKSELENIYFKQADSQLYREITNKLKSTEKDRNKLMVQFIEPLKQKLSDAGIKYKLKMRTKSAYSIWKKMQAQNVGFEGVFDVFAIRFIIDCDADRETEHALCWKVFSYVTEEYESDTNRLRDWITNPKPNGYESLHITVKNSEGVCLEVQIRTKRMDDIAESGLASHWSYKGVKREATLDMWLTSVRHLMEHPEDGNMADYREDLSNKEIFVFTPSGSIRKLAAGATVLDFAFDIHSNLGVKCTGGKVNGKVASIRDRLNTGDVVEIMSGKNQKPSPDWLNWTVTSKARSKIRQKLKEEEFRKAAEGKEILSRRLKNWKLEFPDDLMTEYLKKYQYKTQNSFYAAVGEGLADPADVKAFIQEQEQKQNQGTEETKIKTWSDAYKGQGSDDILVINAKNVKGLDYKMSKCCNPVFGDDVFGFVTIKDGVKIHRMSCPNASRLMQMYPYRIQKVRWSDTPGTSSFQTSLKLSADMEPSVINEIMDVINTFKASVRAFNVSENEKKCTYEITMKISVTNSQELDKVISQMKLIRSVRKIGRI